MRKTQTIDRGAVLGVGAMILAGQLSALRDIGVVDNDHLDRLADFSVRAAIALERAIPRAEERLAAEVAAAESNEAAEAEAAVAAKAAEDAAAKASEDAAAKAAEPKTAKAPAKA